MSEHNSLTHSMKGQKILLKLLHTVTGDSYSLSCLSNRTLSAASSSSPYIILHGKQFFSYQTHTRISLSRLDNSLSRVYSLFSFLCLCVYLISRSYFSELAFGILLCIGDGHSIKYWLSEFLSRVDCYILLEGHFSSFRQFRVSFHKSGNSYCWSHYYFSCIDFFSFILHRQSRLIGRNSV